MTRNLWRAEWLKARKSTVNKVLYRIILIGICLVYVVLTIVTLVNRDEMLVSARGGLPFPAPAIGVNSMFLEIGPILAMIFIAASIGHEYTRDTWKMVLPRYGSRVAFLVTKLASGLLWLVIMLLSLLVVATVAGLIAALVVGVDLVDSRALTGHMLGQQLTIAGLAMLSSSFYGLLTLLLTVMSRSTIMGVGAGFMLMILGDQLAAGLGLIWKPLAQLWPLTHITNLKAAWIDDLAMMRSMVEFTFKGPVSTTQSLLTLLAYMLIFAGGAFYLFRKRDMAG
jgi:ABC-2 type transport system permease protein